MSVCKTIPEVPVLRDRDIKKVYSFIKDASWVIAAVDNLKVIEKILQEKEILEKAKSSESINNVISCLHKLDNYRLQLHEQLEIESIQGFILKQNYTNFPNEIQALTNASVSCVKNEAVQCNKKMKKEATFIKAEIERMQIEMSRCEVENDDLLLIQKKTEEEESKIIDEYNMRLKKKLQFKEELRKIREQIRDENQKIVIIETDILKMKDGLIRQRDEEKKGLEFYKSQIGGILDRKDEWKEKIDVIRPKYNEIMTILKSSDRSIENIKTEVKSEDHKMNTSSRLRGTFQQKIKEELKARDSFTDKKNKHIECLTDLKIEYERELSQKMQNHNEMEAKIIFEKSNHKELEVVAFESEKVLDTFLEIEEDSRLQWKETKDRLDSVQNTMFKYENELLDYAETERNVMEASDLLENTDENQIDKMKILIDTIIEMLNLKKSARIEIEELEECILKQLEELKEERDIFESDTKKLIQKTEAESVQKKEDIKVLQSSIKVTVGEIQAKLTEMQKMQDKFEEDCQKCESVIKTVENEANEQEKLLIEYNAKIQALAESAQQLAFENCLQEYSNIYAKQADDKSKFNQLMSTLAKTEEETMNINKIKAEQESHMKILSEEYFAILKSDMQQMDKIEAEIYKQTCRLKFLKLENSILKEGIAESKEMIEEANKINQNEILLQKVIKRFIKHLKVRFMNKEKEMEEIAMITLERDRPLIENYSSVLKVIRYNLAVLSSVLQQICQKTEKLNSSWPIMEKMKPVRESAVKKIVTKCSQSLTKPVM